MTKSKDSMVTRDILYLRISVGWCLFRVVSGNRYLSRYSNKNTLCIPSTGNVSDAKWIIPLVAIQLLDFVMIY